MSQPSPTGSSLARSARTVSLAVLGSRVLGLVREQILAGLFGASREFDAFVTAFRIPNLLRDLFAEGALSAAFVTTFAQKLTKEGDAAAWRLANLVLNALLVVLSLVVLAGLVAAPWLVKAIAPGFRDVPGKTELTITLTRIMFPFLLLVALAALAMGILNAKKRFGVAASASMMFNIGSIAGGLLCGYFLDPQFGPRAIIGVAIGTLIGGAAQWLIQVPGVFRLGYRYAATLDWRDPGFQQVLRLLGPAVMGVAAVQINVFVNNWFASYYGDGAVTWLNCAFRLMQFPIGVFGVAIGMVSITSLSTLAARGETDQFRTTLGQAIRLALFLTVPAACGLAVLAKPIIAVIYQHGRFDEAATAQTALCLQAYAVGLAGYAAIKVLGPAFYALHDARTPMRVAVLSIGLNIVLNWLFARQFGWGVPGLALATATVAILNFVQLLIAMRAKTGHVEARALGTTLLKVGVASGTMSVATWAVQPVLDFNRYLSLAGTIGVGAVVFAVVCCWLRLPEFGQLLAALRLNRRRKDLEQAG